MTIRDGNNPGNDSEIIEVIKVRRHTQEERDLPPSVSEPTFKPSKSSFRSRASRAFSSIRNVGRSVSRSRISPSDEESSRAPSPTPSRRGSMVFSSLFSHQPSLKSRSSFDSFNDPSPLQASSSVPLGQIHAPSSAEMHGFAPYPDTDDEDVEEDIQTTPRASRIPTSLRSSSSSTSVPQFSRRRFSVLNLFSASKDSDISDAGPSTVTLPSTPIPPSLSRDSIGPSRTDSTESSTSSGPETPVDDVFPEPLPHRPSISLLKRLPTFSRSPRKSRAGTTPIIVAKPVTPSSDREEDLSFGEIRLDSLHFDEMSFDATRF
ncbi:hypothetical protein BT96DRAFT_915421 [Gymnopus androsaceus JB14]|uniref:Uncharacterized protein n=1 Tax=Gymnopus androsaceus JB14 TaxID=1447944 RepID=A0A6A4ICL1_9AGAR|nr:hypothetical protein BT96DRAFT_915421 [Gymnopus androsaceus JB14]